MMTCDDLDRLMTRFVDGECSASDRSEIVAHLHQCQGCQARVAVESAARELVRTHAAFARTQGAIPRWRPRVMRLGRPWLPVRTAPLLLAGAVAAGLGSWLARPTQVLAAGVIGDSHCQQQHRLATRFRVDDRRCTLGCVRLGAEFVLVTDTQVYRISNQQLPDLAAFAGRRVMAKGVLDDGRLRVATLTLESAARGPAGQPE